jgi:outer membrane protein TolC
MKASNTFILLLGLFIFVTVPTQAITLDDYLSLIRSNHPFFIKESLSGDIERKNQASYLGNKDWFLSSNPFFSYNEPLATGPFIPKSIKDFQVGLSAERAFWSTGGRLGLTWSSEVLRQRTTDIIIPGVITIPSGPADFYEQALAATYSQPLLQNRGGVLDRLGYDLAEFTVKSTEVQAVENQEDFLLEMGTRFLDWVLLEKQVDIAKARLNIAEEQLEEIQRRRKANLVDKVDVLRSEDAVRIAEYRVLLLESQWKAKQAELATIASSEEIYSQTPEFKLFDLAELPPIEESVDRLRTGARALRVLRTLREQLAVQRGSLNNLGKAQLDLNLSAVLQDGDPEFGSSFSFNHTDYAIGLLFTYPLGNTTVNADKQSLDLQIRQFTEELKNVELELEASIRALHIQIKQLEDVMDLNRRQLELARDKTEEETKMYNQGRSLLTFVIQSLDSEENSRLIYAESAAVYHSLVLQYQALMDELLPDNQ